MKNNRIILLIAFLMCVSVQQAKADSPLTSTYFASYYYEYPIVGQAETSRGLNAAIMAYLADDNNLLDVKAAVINAIGWNYESTSNASQFWDYLATKHGLTSQTLTMSSLNAHELFCYGYLLALDDYFNVDAAITALTLAAEKNTTSYTIALVLAITEAQKAMDYDWCAVWKYTREVLNDTTLKRDIKTAAIQSVVDYMILYKSSCAE